MSCTISQGCPCLCADIYSRKPYLSLPGTAMPFNMTHVPYQPLHSAWQCMSMSTKMLVDQLTMLQYMFQEMLLA